MQRFSFDPKIYRKELESVVLDLLNLEDVTPKSVDKILKKHPKDKNQIFSRDQVISAVDMVKSELNNSSSNAELATVFSTIYAIGAKLDELRDAIKMKPMRTESGVTTVTVLTKPFACPGKCVFCPNDVRMPKSYIATEPGAQRALMNRFSPYGQVFNRLKAIKNIGHPTDKIELLILGGTWSYYPRKYKIWFINECFRAMNEFDIDVNLEDLEQTKTIDITEDLKNDINEELRNKIGDKPYNQLIVSKEFKESFSSKIIEPPADASIDALLDDLKTQQDINSKGNCRCVGLVLETRPDSITEKEVLDLRRFGATKIQLGIQTLDDEISDMNKRGEHRVDTSKAFQLLRAGGFKIHAHIMPNLYGATPQKDVEVYKELFDSPEYKPDELKIYPTSIIKNTELYDLWQEGKYHPYSTQELVDLLADCIEYTPEYCRLTRIIRDIPSTEIEAGNKTTNLREVVEHKLKKENRQNRNIRAREIGLLKVTSDDLELDEIEYKTEWATEYFLQYITKDRKIAGFLRLSVPNSKENVITSELDECAIIREVHVYGPSLKLKSDSAGEAQHLGLGTKLIERAKSLASAANYSKLAVISSIGTREYYQKRGFKLDDVYQICDL